MDHCMISDDDEEEDYSFKEPSRVDVDDYQPQNSSYKIITRESLLASQMDHLHRVMDLLSVRQHHARTLLIHCRWDTERLLQVYVEKGRDVLFAQAGVSIVEHQKVPSFLNVIRCEICMEDVSSIDDVSTMECGHSHCNSCWTRHFTVKINEGQSRYVRCMTFQCKAICDEAIVSCLIRRSDIKLAEKFEKSLLESYIDDNKKVKWCPSVPHCGNAICVDDEEICEVQCSCGLHFCFKCLEPEHSPCSCLIWEVWNQKCRDESETMKWMAVHTKKCPGCNGCAQKVSGCNSVQCICGQTFCWKCGRATKAFYDIGHTCGVYNESLKAKTIEFAKRDYDRYMHYYNHHKAHADSFKLETRLKEKMQYKVSILEEKQTKLKDFSWVTIGIGRLFRSRHVLSNSYPLAYIIFGNHPFEDEMTKKERDMKQHLFEYHQQQLEVHVENLSKFLEKPFHDNLPEDEVIEIKMQVLDLSKITNTLCKKMYEYIEDELLASLQVGQHSIAPYNMSFGVESALKLRPSLPATYGPTAKVTDMAKRQGLVITKKIVKRNKHGQGSRRNINT